MKDMTSESDREFQDTVGDLAKSFNINNDAVIIGQMLYKIAEEKKSTNLVLREINAKFDQILHKINMIEDEINESKTNHKDHLSERDQEVLDFVKGQKEVCAEIVQKKFDYKGTNAASSRLNKLFKDGFLDKTYKGRKVYFTAPQA